MHTVHRTRCRPTIQILDFRSNLLTSLNDNIVHATLTKLDLAGNQIEEIRGLDALMNLEILNVINNHLRRIQGRPIPPVWAYEYLLGHPSAHLL